MRGFCKPQNTVRFRIGAPEIVAKYDDKTRWRYMMLSVGAILVLVALVLAIIALVKSGGSIPIVLLAVSAFLLSLDLLIGASAHI